MVHAAPGAIFNVLHLGEKVPSVPRSAPLFARLSQPHPLRADTVASHVGTLAPDAEQGSAYHAWFVHAPHPRHVRWEGDIVKALKADRLWKDSLEYSRLRASEPDALLLPSLGLESVRSIEEEGEWMDDGHEALESSTPVFVLLLDEHEVSVGFVRFSLTWKAHRDKRAADRQGTEGDHLEVFVHSAWLRPSLRGKGLGQLMAKAVVHGVDVQLQMLEQDMSAAASFHVEYAGEAYSTSGASFLSQCAQWHSAAHLAKPQRKRLRESSVGYEAR